MKHKNTWESMVTAVRGLSFALRRQRSVKIIAVVALAVTVSSLWLSLSAVEYMILSVTVTLVFMAELLNSGLEYAIDLVTEEYHDLAKAAKDVAAAAVLLSCLNSLIVAFLLAASRLGWI